MPAPYRVALVCLGNICRSPIAAVVLERRLAETDLDVEVSSAGTGGWHTGEPMDPRAAAALTAAGDDPSRHRARLFEADWFDRDLILAMDAQNLADIEALAHEAGVEPRPGQVRLFRSFDPEVAPGAEIPDVPDPYYGGTADFDRILDVVERTTAALVDWLAEHAPRRSA